MDRDLAFRVRSLIVWPCHRLSLYSRLVSSDDLPHTKFAGDSKAEASDDCPRAKVRQLIAVVANTFAAAFVAIHKGRVWDPVFWGLIFELSTARVVPLDTPSDLVVDSLLHRSGDVAHLRGYLPYVLLECHHTMFLWNHYWRWLGRGHTVKKLPL